MSHIISATAPLRIFAPVRRRLPTTPATTLLLSCPVGASTWSSWVLTSGTGCRRLGWAALRLRARDASRLVALVYTWGLLGLPQLAANRWLCCPIGVGLGST